jgi:hypothetical protein
LLLAFLKFFVGDFLRRWESGIIWSRCIF